MDGIDHEYTKEVVCPHCGYEENDSWEYSDDTETECSECGKLFGISIHEEVTYVTYKPDKCEDCGKIEAFSYSINYGKKLCDRCRIENHKRAWLPKESKV